MTTSRKRSDYNCTRFTHSLTSIYPPENAKIDGWRTKSHLWKRMCSIHVIASQFAKQYNWSTHAWLWLRRLASAHTFCMNESPWWLSSFQQIVSSMSCAAFISHDTNRHRSVAVAENIALELPTSIQSTLPPKDPLLQQHYLGGYQCHPSEL